MDGPSAMVRLLLQGRKLNPSVYMSESERTPGKRNRSQVPPSVCRSSRMAKLLVGRWAFTKQTAPMPESPAPTRSTSTCCGCRRQIEMSPLAQIEMSLSLFWVCREREADDGDLHEPPGD